MVPRATLIDQRAGRTAQRETQPNSMNTTKSEDESIVSYVIELSTCAFPLDCVVLKKWPTIYHAYITLPLLELIALPTLSSGN